MADEKVRDARGDGSVGVSPKATGDPSEAEIYIVEGTGASRRRSSLLRCHIPRLNGSRLTGRFGRWSHSSVA